MSGITISKEYSYVLLTAIAAGFQVILTGALYVGPARAKAFNGNYMKSQTALTEEHKKATGALTLPKGGYPDMGTSRYAASLPYADWYALQCAQRAHYNLVEWAASILLFLLISGVFYPTQAAIAGVAWIIGREIYSIGYTKNGPKGRTLGAIIADVAGVFLLIAAINGCLLTAGLPSIPTASLKFW